jgi:hypothetical protein
MCLSRIMNQRERNRTRLEIDEKGSIVAYRKFDKNSRGELFPVFNSNGKTIPIGQWLDEKDYRKKERLTFNNPDAIMAGRGGVLYWKGWHAFMDREEVTLFTGAMVAKVHLKGLVDMGYQEGRPCLVSRYMKVVEILN